MEQLLRDGLASLGLPREGVPALLRYAEALVETNKVMNLTAITEPADIAALHFLDSAALLTLADFRNKSVVDVGTGAGFPGMPLRILEPSIHLTLLDSLNKRIAFLRGVCEELGGHVAITVAVIIMTGILGNMIAETIFRLLRIEEPIARGVALGTSAHAIGTAKALELGEVEGAMSSLSIAVAGILTVFGASLFAGFL